MALKPVVEGLPSQGRKDNCIGAEILGARFHSMGHEPGEKETSTPEVTSALGLSDELLHGANLKK
jgi:hypothetical protein